jgi:hypothetical protein
VYDWGDGTGLVFVRGGEMEGPGGERKRERKEYVYVVQNRAKS